MATINKLGNIVARCPYCDGSKATFECSPSSRELGAVSVTIRDRYWPSPPIHIQFRLYRCAGCGAGALARIKMMSHGNGFPEDIWELLEFFPEAKERLPLPKDVPNGIANEFREAELCTESHCFRAAAAMFRSVLDKTLRANGYKTKEHRDLKSQIDAAAADGVITQARQKRAHEEVRVLGNDVLHDEWHEVKEADVQATHHYTQRILEDFYDDRPSVLSLLKGANRIPDEHKTKEPEKA